MIGANAHVLPIRHPRTGGSRENVSVGLEKRMKKPWSMDV